MPYFSCAYERLWFCANKDEAILMTIMDLVIVYGDEGCCVLGTEDVVIIMCKRDASTSRRWTYVCKSGVISYVGGRYGCHLEVAVILCHFMREDTGNFVCQWQTSYVGEMQWVNERCSDFYVGVRCSAIRSMRDPMIYYTGRQSNSSVGERGSDFLRRVGWSAIG